jgi:protein arginine N-methyltransferase 1
MKAYLTALRNAINSNSVVLDVGTGVGMFALLACRFGAGHVYAVEPCDAIQVGREIAAANGYSDRITFIQDISTNVDLPERADIIVSDLAGALPLYGKHIPSITDARERFLATSGTLIPQQDRLRAGIIESSEQYNKLILPWNANLFGLDLRAGWPLVANTPTKLNDKQLRFLAPPMTMAVLDYRSIVDSNVDSEVAWTVEQPGTGHGAVVWFDRMVADGIEISNEPGAPEAVNTSSTYGQIFFPWPNPVGLDPGDRVSVRLRANLIKENYLWRWESTIHVGRRIKAHFCQSSMEAGPLSLGSLKSRECEYVPAPNEDIQIDAFVLSKVDGHASIGELARALVAIFPSRFASWQDALSRVGEVTTEYYRRQQVPVRSHHNLHA